MRLILSRHGNTFAPGEKVVWAGSRNDLPLVREGEQQARRLGRALRAAGVRPDLVICGPLLRTRDYAALVLSELGGELQPAVDRRLDEIDYGEWSGLSDQEVSERFGEELLAGWNKRCDWPRDCGWQPSAGEVEREVREFTAELAAQHSARTILVITSNGRLRYFLKLIPGAFDSHVAAGEFKVKTGHVCELEVHDSTVSLVYWNREPADGLFAQA